MVAIAPLAKARETAGITPAQDTDIQAGWRRCPPPYAFNQGAPPPKCTTWPLVQPQRRYRLAQITPTGLAATSDKAPSASHGRHAGPGASSHGSLCLMLRGASGS